ncbi:BRD4-interacting chromatin-remodeling complex-associated protein-like isoform X2 [Polyodon spathula]|nr:BRD4-interacting chromatin-remodeling complex-associated protein-like isoform X2 [Polyodon spathula]XP_041107641.1 BRD4-interacting chromatin-remodeling complex-associated protein-like isoform X2 [Polyodon spathula]XP_041107642.1 BRD4-interacting chromatin-remodeling complex-associated protein-like isoform X2 [Polyodon spathula]XP_041107643.1 BRD4-interacting chromatin-remodeling complex-associated protein-like isoform X2 [Polyodon spathula]
MDDDDDRRLLDIIGDVQALNDYLHGSSIKSIDDDDLASAAFGSANSLFASSTSAGPPILKDVSNHLGGPAGAGLQLSSSLQFLEDELGGASPPMGGELREEQPFDILQKSLQEANITEQTLAQEAFLESSSLYPSQPFPQQLGLSHLPLLQQPIGGHFPNMQPHSFIQQVHPQHLHNGHPAGHIQLLGSFNAQPSMMTINNLERPQIILKPGQPSSPGMGSGLLVQRQPSSSSSAGCVPMFSSSVGTQLAMPFKGCGLQTPLPLQNIIIQRDPSQSLGGNAAMTANQSQKGSISIQPKPLQVGHQTVYSVNSMGIQSQQQQQGSPYVSDSSPQAGQQQQMTVDTANQPGLRKATPGHQGINHSASSIVIHSPMGGQHQQLQQQQQQPHLPQNQFLLPTSLSVTPSSTGHSVQALNGQILHTQQGQLQSNNADPVFSNRTAANPSYSGSIMANHNASVQVISGQSLAARGGQFLVNQQLQQVSPTVLHLSASQGNMPTARAEFPMSGQADSMMVQGVQIQNRFAVMNSTGSMHPGYGAQSQPGVQGGTAQQALQQQQQQQQQLQVSQQVPISTGHRFLIPVSQASSTSTQHVGNHVAQQHFETPPFGQSQVQKEATIQTSAGFVSKLQDGLRQPQLVNLLSNKAGKVLGGLSSNLENVLHLQNRVSIQSPLHQNTQVGTQKRPASQQLTKGSFILQQLHKDQTCVHAADRSPFTCVDEAIHRLLPYHVFQGLLPSQEEFTKVDDEFEAVSTQVLKRTQAMLNKYRRLLLEESKRLNPSSEMVMIDRAFNQEERATLTRAKRLSLMDPDGFLEDFCCLAKPTEQSAGEETAPPHLALSSPSCASPSWARLPGLRAEPRGSSPAPRSSLQCDSADSPEQMRKDSQTAKPSGTLPKGPGGEAPPQQEVSLNQHLETAIKSILDLKKSQRPPLSSNKSNNNNSSTATPPAPPAPVSTAQPNATTTEPVAGRRSDKPLTPQAGQGAGDTDSALEAAVNSILEC